MTRTVPQRLEDAAALFRQRDEAYGSNYTLFGPVMRAMFPEGLSVSTDEEFGRLVHVCHMVTKLTRYARNLRTGGHADSLEDLSVYAQMQAEMDDAARQATVPVQETDSLGDRVSAQPRWHHPPVR